MDGNNEENEENENNNNSDRSKSSCTPTTTPSIEQEFQSIGGVIPVGYGGILQVAESHELGTMKDTSLQEQQERQEQQSSCAPTTTPSIEPEFLPVRGVIPTGYGGILRMVEPHGLETPKATWSNKASVDGSQPSLHAPECTIPEGIQQRRLPVHQPEEVLVWDDDEGIDGVTEEPETLLR